VRESEVENVLLGGAEGFLWTRKIPGPNLGILYDNGHGVAQDYAQAREWYERAAAKNDANASLVYQLSPTGPTAWCGSHVITVRAAVSTARRN
jgi:Sel1 repeat